MTVAEAKVVVERHLKEYERRIKEDPARLNQWIDQAYGFVQGVQIAVDGLYEEWGENWTAWHMSVHPAYNAEPYPYSALTD